ncbi:transposable element Tcb1 transposase [Trichonephila clavipes]|nr:transposable element Tcb1 transposase [Trichonephila clavipes]
MEAGWSARRVARQFGHSDCVVRRCCNQWIRKMLFTRRLRTPSTDQSPPHRVTSPHCYYPSFACPSPRFVSNRAYLGSFETERWASYEFERTKSKGIANMERNVSRHHVTLVCLNARSYQIVQIQEGIQSSVLLPFSLK